MTKKTCNDSTDENFCVELARMVVYKSQNTHKKLSHECNTLHRS